MIAIIDFSIFQSPTKAYGSVTGEIAVPDSVKVGDEIAVMKNYSANGFCGRLRVTSVSSMKDDPPRLLVGLDDVVLSSIDDALALTQDLEGQAGLFVDPYDA